MGFGIDSVRRGMGGGGAVRLATGLITRAGGGGEGEESTTGVWEAGLI